MIFTKKLLLIKGGAFKLFLYKFKHHAKVLENIMMDKSLIHKIFAVVALSVAGIDCIGIEGAELYILIGAVKEASLSVDTYDNAATVLGDKLKY